MPTQESAPDTADEDIAGAAQPGGGPREPRRPRATSGPRPRAALKRSRPFATPHRRALARAAALSAALAAVAYCAGCALARSFPFGPYTRAVNDLGNQYVPYHAKLWDLLHGRGDGGLSLNWQSGYGAAFLPDLGTYLTSPFAPLVALFPREDIDHALYAITVLKIAAAAAAMTWLLLSLRRGRWWAAALLGASYALCGWSVADAAFNPMWQDGLIALPMLCLVGEWALAGRRPVLGVLVVALAWTANFYTAYMATLGAALVLLARLLAADAGVPPGRRWPRVLGRAAGTAVLGVGLAAPVVLVVHAGTRHAYPGRDLAFAPVPWTDVFARLLPASYSFSSPALSLDLAVLLLALALPFHSALPRRVRAVWAVLPAAATASLQWGPTHLAWHAFATPNGSQYRQAFVVCGLVVIAGWLAFARGLPGRRALLAGGGLLALVVAAAVPSELTRGWTAATLAAGAAVTGAGLLLLRRAERARRPAAVALAAGLLAVAHLGQSAATVALATRARVHQQDDYAPWGARQRAQRDLITAVDGWPRYRTDPGREQTVGNDPLLVGGQGAQYYSSHTSDVLSRTLTALGHGWTSRGRSLQSLDNPVTDAIFSVGARVHSPPDPHQRWFEPDGSTLHVSRQEVPPLVTVRPAGPEPAYGASPFRNQELLLGERVYTVPAARLRVAGRPVAPSTVDGGHRLTRAGNGAGRGTVLSAVCAPGDEVHLYAPRYWGTARQSGSQVVGRFRGDPVSRNAGMRPLGAVPPSGRVEVELTALADGEIPEGAIGCLDRGRLRAAVDRLRATGATEVRAGDFGVRAVLPAGSTGRAVVAAPRIAGWRCAVDGGPARPAENHLGLVSVPLGAGDGARGERVVECSFRPPGLRAGTAVGAASLAALAGLVVLVSIRRRRSGRTARGAGAAAVSR
ncbi:YfhO family protein [Streptomyces sp. URMC 123]|uniref:YfhO family protein n=1 Tax=Streptomyces sp. URMC 123 TaxID=3423403 RepID=UPI003F1AAFFC